MYLWRSGRLCVVMGRAQGDGERAASGPGEGRRMRTATTPGAGRYHAVVVQSDIVGSTRLIERAGDGYAGLLVRHRQIIAGAVARRGGRFLSHAGDGTLAVFDGPGAALGAAADAQAALAAEPWPDGLAVRARMGVHAGEVSDIDGEPVGLVINRGARMMAAAHAGQVAVSDEVVDALGALGAGTGDRLDPGLALADAGRHDLRDHVEPVRLHQLAGEGLTVVLPGCGSLVAA